MNFDFLKLKPEVFGLDISDRSLKLVKINHKKDIVAFGGIKIEDSIIDKGEVQDVEALSEKIKELTNKISGLKTKHVVVSLPEEKSFIRVMRLPKMSALETKKAVLFEAENYIPFSIDNVYFDSQILEDINSEKYTEVLLAALPKITVDPYVEACRLADLMPVAFETESQGTVRAVIEGGRTKEPIFIVDIGATCSNFSVFQGSGLRFASFIPFSTIEYTQAIADRMKVDFEKAEEFKKRHGLENISGIGDKVFGALLNPVTDFITQLTKHIDYYQSTSKQKITNPKLILCGGGANLKELDSYLSKKMGVQAVKSNPLVNLNKSGIPQEQLLSYATAIGLALRKHD